MTALDTEAGKTRPANDLDGPLAFNSDQKRKLREFVKRAEHVEGELKSLNEDKTSLYEEVDDAGFDTKLVKKVVKARQKSKAERDYEQERFQFYMDVVGED